MADWIDTRHTLAGASLISTHPDYVRLYVFANYWLILDTPPKTVRRRVYVHKSKIYIPDELLTHECVINNPWDYTEHFKYWRIDHDELLSIENVLKIHLVSETGLTIASVRLLCKRLPWEVSAIKSGRRYGDYQVWNPCSRRWEE